MKTRAGKSLPNLQLHLWSGGPNLRKEPTHSSREGLWLEPVIPQLTSKHLEN